MDPLNIITGIVLLYSITANISGAKKAMKKKLTGVLERPKSYLQKTPPNISALILVFTILGIFQIGIIQPEIENQYLKGHCKVGLKTALRYWFSIKNP